MNTRRALAVAALALTVTGTATAHTQHESAASKAMPKATWMTRACAYEDSVNCFWDASVKGNHHGHSFYVREVPGRAAMVCVMYVTARDQKRWDYCEATGARGTRAPVQHDYDHDSYGE